MKEVHTALRSSARPGKVQPKTEQTSRTDPVTQSLPSRGPRSVAFATRLPSASSCGTATSSREQLKAAVSSEAPFLTRRYSTAEIETGKPFRNSYFIFDIDNKKDYERLSREIERLGGKIVHSVEEKRLPNLCISDHATAEKLEALSDPLRQLSASQLRSVPRLVRECWSSRVRMRSVRKFDEVLAQLRERVKQAVKRKYGDVANEENLRKSNGAGVLCSPFIKLEIIPEVDSQKHDNKSRRTLYHRPWVAEFDEKEITSRIFLGTDFGRSLFHMATESERRKRQEEEAECGTRLLWLRAHGLEPNTPRKREAKEKKRNEQVLCEVCQFVIEPEHVDAHFATADHRAKACTPGIFDNIDVYLGVREDFADVIRRPPEQDAVWPEEPLYVAMHSELSYDQSSVDLSIHSSKENVDWACSTRFAKPLLDRKALCILHMLRAAMRHTAVKKEDSRRSVLTPSKKVSDSGSNRSNKSHIVFALRSFRAAILADKFVEAASSSLAAHTNGDPENVAEEEQQDYAVCSAQGRPLTQSQSQHPSQRDCLMEKLRHRVSNRRRCGRPLVIEPQKL